MLSDIFESTTIHAMLLQQLFRILDDWCLCSEGVPGYYHGHRFGVGDELLDDCWEVRYGPRAILDELDGREGV